MYSSTVSLTSALDGCGSSTPRPGRFTPGKTRYPLYRRLGGTQSRCGRVRSISSPPGFDPRTVQPVASRYTVCAILARNFLKCVVTYYLEGNFKVNFLLKIKLWISKGKCYSS